MANGKKPKGWYGKAAKAERKDARERRAEGRRSAKVMAERDAAARAERRAASRLIVESQAVRIEARAAETHEARAAADKIYARAAKALRKELEPKLSGVDRGTPHTRRQHRKTSFERLCDARCVTGEMLQAAQEIDRVYLAICGSIMAKAQTIGTADTVRLGQCPTAWRWRMPGTIGHGPMSSRAYATEAAGRCLRSLSTSWSMVGRFVMSRKTSD